MGALPIVWCFVQSQAVMIGAANAEEDDEPISPRWRVLRGHITTNSIPWLLAGSDIIVGLASGMTLKFLPIFLLQACNLDPITVNIFTFVSPLLIAAIMFSLPPLAKALGTLTAFCCLKPGMHRHVLAYLSRQCSC